MTISEKLNFSIIIFLNPPLCKTTVRTLNSFNTPQVVMWDGGNRDDYIASLYRVGRGVSRMMHDLHWLTVRQRHKLVVMCQDWCMIYTGWQFVRGTSLSWCVTTGAWSTLADSFSEAQACRDAPLNLTSALALWHLHVSQVPGRQHLRSARRCQLSDPRVHDSTFGTMHFPDQQSGTHLLDPAVVNGSREHTCSLDTECCPLLYDIKLYKSTITYLLHYLHHRCD